ncbi:hypothetical protein II1_03057 [Bacillus cereus MC118]|uniref:Uncharacterized protein n=1 Tax=Bacillus cereus MC67 TaxID=1053219 RepID=J8F1Y2_BACCE|nr:hypothetical protein II3_01094 [Bacillus cereus MC67]EOP13853.1 hypothetical protein II1_03057 [Bacillus cereus MC118]RAN71440.1 hypothetical protein B5P40_06790 [Bacillus sp. SRB_8]
MCKYRCYVRWTSGGKGYLSNFTTETDKGSSWLHSDITKSYNNQLRYTIDGKLINVEVEEIVANEK